jgi:hypothetical protein
MCFTNTFLVGSFILVVGAVVALWRTAMLAHVTPVWVTVGLLVAVGVGVMLSVSSGRPAGSIEASRGSAYQRQRTGVRCQPAHVRDSARQGLAGS